MLIGITPLVSIPILDIRRKNWIDLDANDDIEWMMNANDMCRPMMDMDMGYVHLVLDVSHPISKTLPKMAIWGQMLISVIRLNINTIQYPRQKGMPI